MAKDKKTRQPTPAPVQPGWLDARWYPWALAGCYLVVLIVTFKEFVFSDRMLYGSDTLQAVVYFRSFYVNAVHHGVFPAWSPYLFGGMPFVDAFHSDIFYPFTAIKFLLPLDRTRGWELILHFWLGGMGMYAAARGWGISRIAATVSGLAYMTATYFVSMVHPGHDGKIYVTAWFPLGFLFLKRIWDRGRLRDMGILALIIGVIILSPHVQMAYFALWAYAGYSVYRIVRAIREDHRIPWIKSAGALAAVGLAVCISAIQFYPSYFYVKNHSPRAGEGRGFEYASSWSLHPEEIASEIVPEFSGVADKSTNTYWGRNFFKDNSEYGGVVALLLAVFAVFRTRFRDRWFFLGLGVFAALYALGAHTPLFKLFYYVVPNVKQMRAPSMIMFLYVFSITLCAGAAIDAPAHVRAEGSGGARVTGRLPWVLGTALAGLALLFSIAPAAMMSLYTSLLYSDISSERAAVMTSHLNAIVVGLWISALLALALAYFWTRLAARPGLWPVSGIMLLVLIDTGRMNPRFIETIDLNRYFPDDPVVDFLKSQPQPVRVLPYPRGFPTNYFALKGVAEIGGYHGNQLRSYNDFLGGSAQPRMYTREAIDLSSTEFLLFRRGANLQGDPVDPSVEKVYDQGGVVVFRNLQALPYARLVSSWELHDARDTLYDRLFAPDFDYRNRALVESALPFESAPDTSSPGTARIASYDLEHVEIDVAATREALLVLADNAYPAWHAYLDGERTDIITTNATFRGVVVPPGTHRVRFVYESGRLYAGAWITLVSTLAAGLVIGWDGLRRQRNAE